MPFAKTGGLADVTGALPKALRRLRHDVRIIMPRYRAVNPATFGLTRRREALRLTLGGKTLEAGLEEARVPATDIPVYFVDQPALFDRDGLYQARGADFPDNLERFSLFSQAVLDLIPQLGWHPDVVHCHDWQTSLVCAHLALTRAQDPFWGSAGTVLTVHNLAYQGLFPREAWGLTNLPDRAFGIEGLEFYGQVNCLKGGLMFADRLSTVSPTYAKEIQSPAFGCGLEGVLAKRRGELVGILNGMDPEEWDPRGDPHLTAHYSTENLRGKSACKRAVQAQQGLPVRPVLLIGMIQRLAEQKGIDIFTQAAEDLLRLPLQIIILGTGEARYHEKLSALAAAHPNRLTVSLRFDNALAHQIEAGSDAFLMPSRFEPCGLNQLYSMRYGTVPIVHRTGGLADTVVDLSSSTLKQQTATGVVFTDYSAEALLKAVRRAVDLFRAKSRWQALVRLCMRQDFSWERSANDYVRLYEQAIASHAPSVAHVV